MRPEGSLTPVPEAPLPVSISGPVPPPAGAAGEPALPDAGAAAGPPLPPPQAVCARVVLSAAQMAMVAPHLSVISSSSGAAADSVMMAPGLFAVELSGSCPEVSLARSMFDSLLHTA
jgi:hypothetical protein